MVDEPNIRFSRVANINEVFPKIVTTRYEFYILIFYYFYQYINIKLPITENLRNTIIIRFKIGFLIYFNDVQINKLYL